MKAIADRHQWAVEFISEAGKGTPVLDSVEACDLSLSTPEALNISQFLYPGEWRWVVFLAKVKIWLNQLKSKPTKPKNNTAMRNQLLLLLASFAFGISAAWAQSVSGKVTDSANGEGLPGVAVVVEGSNTGVMSDMDGVYRINAATGDVLTFSFVGYNTVRKRSTAQPWMFPWKAVLPWTRSW